MALFTISGLRNALANEHISSVNRKDFLLSRFVNFDDKPDSYESWRASFQSVTRELGVTPFEEMDLFSVSMSKRS
jgi:hypothetical protein